MPADIDIEKNIIYITKTCHRINKQDIITTLKTTNSTRTITVPNFLSIQLHDYMKRIYGLKNSNRLLPITIHAVRPALKRQCEKSGAKRIRVHDIRHSHVFLLIDMGFPAILIAERIGDTVDMVNNTYGHLYPNRHEEVADKLDQLVSNQ